MTRPPYLHTGDTIRIVSPAKVTDRDSVLAGIKMLEARGFRIKYNPVIFDTYHYFAGNQSVRLQDLQEAFDDREARGIFAARGGYGTSELIDHLDYKTFEQSPKWVAGFSDITALHHALFNSGYQSLHSPVVSQFSRLSKTAFLQFLDLIMGKHDAISLPLSASNRAGTAKGQVIGGNLSLICHMLGTPGHIDFQGKILIIEEVGEKLHHIDRMMNQLKRSGQLTNLAGLVVGNFLEIESNSPSYGLSLAEVIYKHLADTKFPVAFEAPFDHSLHSLSFIHGSAAFLNVSLESVRLEFEHEPRQQA